MNINIDSTSDFSWEIIQTLREEFDSKGMKIALYLLCVPRKIWQFNNAIARLLDKNAFINRKIVKIQFLLGGITMYFFLNLYQIHNITRLIFISHVIEHKYKHWQGIVNGFVRQIHAPNKVKSRLKN